jgi:hypothetical protein
VDYETLTRELHQQRTRHRLVQKGAEESEEFGKIALAAKSKDAAAIEFLGTLENLKNSMSQDNFEQHVLIAARVTRLFKEHGWDLIIVGGSALEFYTEGKYVSGDIDVCRKLGQRPIPAAVEKEVMLKVGATPTGTRRQWKVGPIFIDLLGEIETSRDPNFRSLDTPEGPITLMPSEDVLVERVFVAHSANPPLKEAMDAAEKMTASALDAGGDFDWKKAMSIAGSKEYGILPELNNLVARIRKNENKMDMG